MTKRTISLILVALLAAASTATHGQSIQGRVRRLVQDHHMGETVFAGLIVDLRDDNELAAINADRPMIPASNMKLITTSAALSILGKDFKFQTQLLLLDHDESSGGKTLLIKGAGDPGFGDPDLLARHGLTVDALIGKLVRTVSEAKVTQIKRLTVDDRVFDYNFVHGSWPADQLRYRYCAEVAGLNFHANVLHVWPEPTEIGSSPRVEVRPDVRFIQTSNRAITDHSDTFWADRMPGTNEFVFSGKIANRRREPVRVTVNDPPLFFARLLADRLRDAGIAVERVDRVGKGELLGEGQLLFTVQTTLYEAIRRCNSDSRNLYAESLIKRMGHKFTGAPGSWRNGAAAIRNFLQLRIGPTAAIIGISDGSGLSRDNRVTARNLVRILRSMHEDAQLGEDFRQSLSVGGVRGTLKERFRERLRGRVFAKTGYINGVSTISGYLMGTESESGSTSEHVVVFSLLFNNIKHPIRVRDVKNLQNKIVHLIDEVYHPVTTK